MPAPLMVRSAFRRVSNHEGSRRRHPGTASWFETAFGLLTMRLMKRLVAEES